MVGVEWKFQQFKFGSCSTFVISNDFLEKKRRVRKLVKLNLKIILKLLCIDETNEFFVGTKWYIKTQKQNMCTKDEKLKHMSYLRATKASSMTSKYDPRVSRFQEVYLVTVSKGR